MWPPSMGGLLEASGEYEQRLVEGRHTRRWWWELGIAESSVRQESGSEE